jgi:hypothetical protein
MMLTTNSMKSGSVRLRQTTEQPDFAEYRDRRSSDVKSGPSAAKKDGQANAYQPHSLRQQSLLFLIQYGLRQGGLTQQGNQALNAMLPNLPSHLQGPVSSALQSQWSQAHDFIRNIEANSTTNAFELPSGVTGYNLPPEFGRLGFPASQQVRAMTYASNGNIVLGNHGEPIQIRGTNMTIHLLPWNLQYTVPGMTGTMPLDKNSPPAIMAQAFDILQRTSAGFNPGATLQPLGIPY